LSVAFSKFPEEIEDNYGADVNLPIDDLSRVVHLAKVAVHSRPLEAILTRESWDSDWSYSGMTLEISYGRVQALRSIPEFQYSNHCMSSGPSLFRLLSCKIKISLFQTMFLFRK